MQFTSPLLLATQATISRMSRASCSDPCRPSYVRTPSIPVLRSRRTAPFLAVRSVQRRCEGGRAQVRLAFRLPPFLCSSCSSVPLFLSQVRYDAVCLSLAAVTVSVLAGVQNRASASGHSTSNAGRDVLRLAQQSALHSLQP